MATDGRLVIETVEVNIAVAEQTEDFSVMPTGRYVRLAVADTGTGISAEARAHMFEPFFTTKAAGLGTGLGLATVHGIVKQSGGYLSLKTEVGVGTTFNIFLPVAVRTPDDSTQVSSSAPDVAGTETILLVEDEPMLRDVACRALMSHGYSVLVAGNGREGVERAREHLGPIHLVLSDVMMPEVSGIQLVERLKVDRPDTRVLYMSGYADGDAARMSIEAAGAAFVQKPFSPLQLLEAARRALDA